MTPEQYTAALADVGIDQEALGLTEFDRAAAKLLRVNERTARRYRNGETAIPGPVQVILSRIKTSAA